MALKLNEHENEIITTLIKEGTVTQAQLDELSAKQLKNIENLKNTLFEKIYLLDNTKRQITIFNGNGQETGSIQLETSSKQTFKRDEWQTWGTSVAALDEENKKVGDFYWKLEDNIGIAFSKGKSYYYNPKFEEDKYLVSQSNYIFGAIPKNKVDSYPFDLYLSSDNTLLCISDRGAGSLYLINVLENRLLKTFQLRNPGSTKSLNAAISKKRNKIYVTDNQSPVLTIIDLQGYTTETKNLGMGVLGNVTLSPDEGSLYVLTTKPKQILKLLDLDNYAQKKEFPLKGELFSAGDIPYDFLSTSAERNSIYLMTHIPEPDPFTPVITVIDAEKEKATQRFSLKDGAKLIGIGFAEINPLFRENKTVLELVLDNKLADMNKIEEIKKNLKEELESPNTGTGQIMEMPARQNFTPAPSFAPSQNITEAQPGQSFAETQAQNKGKEEETEWQIKDVPKKMEYTAIHPSLDKIIFEKCSEMILKHYEKIFKELSEAEKWEKADIEINKRVKEIEIKLGKKDTMSSIRLNDAIVKSSRELEWHNLTVIRLKNLFEDYNFEAVFRRNECLEWIRQEEMNELVNAGLKTIATNCPNCDAKLLGSYTCRQCGFELEKPEDALQKKLLQIATVSPFDNLKHGHLIIMDSLNHTFIETDHFRKVIWDLKMSSLLSTTEIEFGDPREAIRLKNNITLIADFQTNRVFKLTEKGRIFWELDRERSAEHKINQPISAAASENGNVIILDYGNHRIIEVNEENEIVWKYGQNGMPGIADNELRFPTSFQRTAAAIVVVTDSMNHRVIEMEERKITWQYGNEKNSEGLDAAGDGPNQLRNPLTAWRSENGNILILDSGNNRVINVNHEKEIIWEYKTDQVENPLKAYLLKTNRVLIIGETKVLEVDYQTKEVTWSCSLDKLGAEPVKEIKPVADNVTKTKITHGTSNPYARRTDLEDLQEKEKRDKLREIIESKRAETTNRTAPEGLNSRSPVLLTPGAEVSDIDFMMVDKTKGTVFMVNRKGATTSVYGENNELSKPQFAYLNFPKGGPIFGNTENSVPKTVLIADSENKRVIEVDIASKEIVWSYSKADEPNKLSYPRSVELTSHDTVIISDQLGSKVIEIDKASSSVIWEYKGSDLLKTPYHASRLDNGNTLIVDWSSHVVLEITPDKNVAWFYGISKKSGNEEGCLSYPEYAQRLKNGNTLIVDTRNARIMEVSPDKKVAWSYEGQGIHKLMSPTYARRMENGNTMIIHSNNKQVIEIDPEGKVLWKYMYQEKK